MKKHILYSILTTLTLVLLIGIASSVPVLIGQTSQWNPFESNPSAFTRAPVHTGFNPATPLNAWDGDDFTQTNIRTTLTTVTGTVATATFSGFDVPTSIPFSADWVDLKMIYEIPGGQTSDDTYTFEYSTDGATWVVLQTPFTLASTPFTKAARPWAQIAEPTDGVWSWDDLAALLFRIRINKVGTLWDVNKNFFVYEIWATVYPFPLPPTEATPTVSVQPANVSGVTAYPGDLGIGSMFFVDVYVQGVTALAGYEFTLSYDTNIITAVDAFGYWPWVDVVVTPDDVTGIINVVGTAEPPIVDVGFNGNSPMARVYFMVDAYGRTTLTLPVSLLGMPGGIAIDHTVYGGMFTSPRYMSFTGGILPPTDPTGTTWHEDYPAFSHSWMLTSWVDNGDGVLSASDQIDMTNETSWLYWFHVDQVSTTIHFTFKAPDTGEGKAEPDPATTEPFGDPTGTRWHMIYPDYSRPFTITSWTDQDAGGFFDASDQFDFEFDDNPGVTVWAHLDSVTTDILVSQKGEPTPGGPVPEFPFGLSILMLLAPLIPIAILWKQRRKVTKQ